MDRNNILLALVLILLHVELLVGLQFTHHMKLDENYQMWWLFDEIHITIKVKVKTKGWVGWGVSDKGAMEGADMVIGLFDHSGTTHFHDRYAEARKEPTIDNQQDYDLIEMTQKNGSTSLTFKRFP